MMFIASIVVFTANILGSFQDPFEFEGDYGPEINPTRQKVFELVLPNHEQYVSFSELVPPEILSRIEDPSIALFLQERGEENAFSYLRNSPKNLLRVDKILRDKASAEGDLLKLSILSSVYPLNGSSPSELKQNLMEQLLESETWELLEPIEIVDKDYAVFQTPQGQIFFYWLYQSLNLHLVSQDPQLIEEINKTKSVFLKTIGDPRRRAETFKEKIFKADAKVLFTQESDQFVAQALIQDGLFIPPEGQNTKDGTLVFLKRDVWDEGVEVIPLQSYPLHQKGKVNLVLATLKETNQKFLLASCHGNSTNPADARLQVEKIMEKFDELVAEYPDLQLLIGIDANTKSEDDVKTFLEHLDSLGLVATEVGPTTVKKRMVTVQHGKSGRLALDQEDYLITLKPERGGSFALLDPTVGFKKGPIDPNQPLPNLENLSDHYPVGATLAQN